MYQENRRWGGNNTANGKLRLLKPLTNKVVNKKAIFGFDIETTQTDETSEKGLNFKKQKFYMGSVVGDNFKKVFYDKKSMQKFMTCSKVLKDNLVFATNLDFDFNMLFDDFKGGEDFFIIERNGRFICVIYRMYGHMWKYLDTMNFTLASVKKLGIMLNHHKLPMPKFIGQRPKNQEEEDELLRYNVNDSFISYKFGKFMQDFCNGMKCKMKITLASTGMDFWRRNYQKQGIFQEKRYIIEKHFEGSIKGGRTENFKRGYFKDIFYYDFNSMYPSVCKDGFDGHGSYPDPSSVKHLRDVNIDYIESIEGITHCQIESPDTYIPLLGSHDKHGKLFFPKGKLTGWWTNVELRYAKELGYKIDNIDEMICYDRSFVPFRDCVKRLYDLRMSYKREGNWPMEQMIKILMNSGLFGKFAQRINEKTNVYHIDSLFVSKDGSCYIIKDGKRIVLAKFEQRGNYVFERIQIPMKIPVFILPILASYTTAMSRSKLHESMNMHPENIIYCDTDSMTVNKKIFESSSYLGKLKLEAEIKEAIFCRPKQYYYHADGKDTVKIKGVVKKVIPDYASFMRVLETGKTKYDRFTKIKESAIRRIPYGSIIEVHKRISLEDDKRIWDGKFSFDRWQDSKALEMIDGVSELEFNKLAEK